MVQFNKEEMKIILNALETIQQARQSITTDAVINGDYIRADAALKHLNEREQIIQRIKAYLNQ